MTGTSMMGTSGLGPDDVHVWTINPGSRQGGAGRQATLDRAERARAACYRSPADRLGFVLRRTALRSILASYTGLDPAGIRFETDHRGRPCLAADHGCDGLDFNVTRTVDLALVAVSRHRVGVDVERLAPRAAATDIVDHWFSDSEAACIAAGCDGSRLRGFYRHWTAKEAYLKVLGCGLSGLRDVELDCGSSPGLRWRREADAGRVLVPVAVSPAHTVAVVTESAAPAVCCREWADDEMRCTPWGR
jgi:4'-phosphopantetheinyl transferase